MPSRGLQAAHSRLGGQWWSEKPHICLIDMGAAAGERLWSPARATGDRRPGRLVHTERLSIALSEFLDSHLSGF